MNRVHGGAESMVNKLKIRLEYCRPCNYTARAAWTAQELLNHFGEWTEELRLVPGEGGAFEIAVDGLQVYSKRETGHFPDMDELGVLISQALSAKIER